MVLEKIRLSQIEGNEEVFREQIQRLKQDFIYIDYEVAKELLNKLETVKQQDLIDTQTQALVAGLVETVEAIREKFRVLLTEMV